MKRFLIVVCATMMTVAGAAPDAAAAVSFPWFHTRPKPVILDDPPPAPKGRVAYHGNAVYPGTGRLYFEDSYDRRPQNNRASTKSRLSSIFSAGWLTGAQPANPNPHRPK